jgi:redox-sensitive bicupin YhaK (pirin superfamily)
MRISDLNNINNLKIDGSEPLKKLQERPMAKVSNRQFVGRDEQADNKALVLEPGRWEDYDPLLLMAEDWFSTQGFDWHPHRGIETITVVLDGKLEHHDNRGGHGILKEGDVQWMTAGKGLLHREMAYNKQPVHTLQLWLNLPSHKKMVEPKYQDLPSDLVPIRQEPGVQVKVFSGQSGNVKGPAANYVPVTMLDISVKGGDDSSSSFIQQIPVGQEGFVYVLSGQGSFGSDGISVAAGQIGHLAKTNPREGPTILTINSKEPSRFLLWTGQPLHEPVIAHGPFVMNTRAQIVEAFSDYDAGFFGPILSSADNEEENGI